MIQLRRACAIFLETLREIFDEASYTRFLESHNLQSTASAYAAFRQDNEAAKARRPKCC